MQLAEKIIRPFGGTFFKSLIAYFADLRFSTTDNRLALSLMLAA